MGVCVPRVGAGHAVHRPRAGHGLLLRHDGNNHLEEQGPRQRRGQPSKMLLYCACFCISKLDISVVHFLQMHLSSLDSNASFPTSNVDHIFINYNLTSACNF